MKARRGQVALYLVMALLAVTVLLVVNVNAFLAVRSKNRRMNAVDEAALAVARFQGELLNEIGRLNVEHLRAAVLGESRTDEDGLARSAAMRNAAFFGPVRALARANAVAADWGFPDGDMARALVGFRDHIAEIRQNPDLYPDPNASSPGENAWLAYADLLDSALSGCPAVLPSYMEMVNPGASGLFGSAGFYDVLAAKAWCWFTLGSNESHLESDPRQIPPTELFPVEVPENSEVFSLHVTFRGWLDSEWREEHVPGVGFSERWTNFVCQVTGLAPEDFSPRSTAADPAQVWAFYDDSWRRWSTTFNPDSFPIAGEVRPEYDVAGCLASCMMIGHIEQLRRDDRTESVSTALVTAEAKPFGTVDGLDGGGPAPVTAYGRFIAASRPGRRIFTEAQLVPMGSVPRSPGASMEPGWYEHLKKHAPTRPQAGCERCRLWSKWLQPSFRDEIRRWLMQNRESCRPKGGSGPVQTGGYEYAH